LKILIVEDDPDIIETISLCLDLRWPDAKLISARTGLEGVKMARNESPDVIVIDLGLPDIDGLEVLEQVRAFSDLPIIILTARSDEMDKVRSLEMGADDYITKPFSHTELLARIRAVIRRSNHLQLIPTAKPFISRRLVIDFAGHAVTVEGNPVRLTPTEYNLLEYLAVNEGNVLTHRALLEKVWGEEYVNSPDYLKVYVQRLRNKIEKDPANPEIILTQRGLGYKLVKPA
jgi:two-component system KDP operon response regulator KdpE